MRKWKKKKETKNQCCGKGSCFLQNLDNLQLFTALWNQWRLAFTPGLAWGFSSLPHLWNSSELPTVISPARWHPGVRAWALQFFAHLWAKLCFSYNGYDRWHFTNTPSFNPQSSPVRKTVLLSSFHRRRKQDFSLVSLTPGLLSEPKGFKISSYQQSACQEQRFPCSQLRDPDSVNVKRSPVICFQQTSLSDEGRV